MNTAEIEYLGERRTEARHLKSGEKIITDAPTDNHGKGEAFSPTDLIASALVSCMITVMDIRAERSGINLGKVTGTVEKTMGDGPRRILQLLVKINFRDHSLSASDKILVESIAINCPVAKSIHPDINQQVRFQYD